VKKGFSLIELMIVIVIMGVIYTLVITKLKSYNETQEALQLETFKPNLGVLAKEFHTKVKLFCFDDCSKCAIFANGKKLKEVSSLFEDTPELYKYNYLNGMEEKKMDVLFDADDVEQDVCFSFGVDEDGVSDQVIVKYKEKVYDYSNYFSDVDIYDTLEEVIDAKEKIIEKVK